MRRKRCDRLYAVPEATSGLARNFLAASLIIAGIGTGALAIAQHATVPTFGTTVVVPGGLLGVVYNVSPLYNFLPDFQRLDPLGVIYTSNLNVTPRGFRDGFPGVTGRYEWFGIDYSGRFWIERPGPYRFELTSEDGSRLYIDGRVIVNNDGIHGPETRIGTAPLDGGIHQIRVSFFKGTRDCVALVLRVAGPGEEWRVFSTDEFKPPPDPATWMHPGQVLHVSSVTSAPGEKVRIEISLDSAGARAPAALKWEVVFPAQLLELEGDEPETGSAAMDSAKLLRCARQNAYSCFCTLSGGQNPVSNGPIAIFHFKTRTAAEAGTTAVRIERAAAVAADSKELTLNNAEGAVTIRQR
jgi:hypothetical protein